MARPKRGVVAKPQAGQATSSAPSPAKPSTPNPETLFETYIDPDQDQITADGCMELCSDLGIEPSDRKILLLAWKMGATQMGCFNRSEFVNGCKLMRVTNLDKLKAALPQLEREVESDPDIFMNFYTFAFRYMLSAEGPGRKILSIESASAMLEIVVPEEPQLGPFLAFLKAQDEYKTITQDQWLGFYRFCQEINYDCSNYDENQAWPLIIDNYVIYRKEQDAKKAAQQ